jgi:hypothetical protein
VDFAGSSGQGNWNFQPRSGVEYYFSQKQEKVAKLRIEI